VRHLLAGQAKAMVVTSSRQEVVRYQLALRAYVTEKGYTDVQPLVTFSGKVPPDEAIPEEVNETSRLLNPDLNGCDPRKAFDTADYNVMIVANKFQTGFDQPKLCAMYVDKKLHSVECVQTLFHLTGKAHASEKSVSQKSFTPSTICSAQKSMKTRYNSSTRLPNASAVRMT
jgi:type I restriction enzyme R subunit